MLPEMTPAAARALQAARQWAGRLHKPEVEPLHLLCGLLEEEEGKASTLLVAAGLDVSSLRETLAAAAGPAQPPSENPLPLTEISRRVFAAAKELVGDYFAETVVSGEALVLALVREDAALRRSLEEHGFDFARCEQAVLAQAVPPLELEEPLQLSEPTERIDAARALDAAANRAREALRVVEDYCRFCLDDALLSRELKEIRHELADALGVIPGGLLVEARETLRDVGTDISLAAESERHSPREVARANLKRLQEALRSLEEFGKLFGGDLGARIERLRYRTYTAERALLLGAAARERLDGCAIQVLLTGSQCGAALDWTIAEAAAGGATMFQLREKELDDRQLLERARNVRRWTRAAGALFIVNDRPDVARLVGADGVHLGQDDMPVKEARRIAGPDLLIGVSTHNLGQLRQAVLDGASYVGVGPTFPSGTKEFAEFPGPDFIRQAVAETSLPVFAIGGIRADTLPAAVAAGARRIAVSQAVCQSDDPRAAVSELLALLRS